MKRNYSIDSAKMLASFAVVFMHVVNYLPTTRFANYWTYDWYFPLLDLAVPLFFIISGYFLRKKDYRDIPSYAFRILVMLIAYNIVYMVIKWVKDILLQLLSGNLSMGTLFSYFTSLKSIDLFTGILGSEHLWFLSALFFASWILYFLKRIHISSSLCVVIGILLFGLSFLPPLNIFSSSFFLYGGFAKAFFYLSLGHWLAQKVINYPYRVIGLVVSLFFLIRIGSNVDSQVVLEVLLAITIFHLLLLLKENLLGENILSRYAQYSMGIYLLHIIFTGFFTTARELYPTINTINPLIVVPIAFTLCTLGSVIMFPYTERFVHQPLIRLFNQLMAKLDYNIHIKPSKL